jgi:hypothetical protein
MRKRSLENPVEACQWHLKTVERVAKRDEGGWGYPRVGEDYVVWRCNAYRRTFVGLFSLRSLVFFYFVLLSAKLCCVLREKRSGDREVVNCELDEA